jgi:hypothetical protein
MNLAVELPPEQAKQLRDAADRLGISPGELARAAIADPLATRDEDFKRATERVLEKNAELYRRLS